MMVILFVLCLRRKKENRKKGGKSPRCNAIKKEAVREGTVLHKWPNK